MRVALFSFVTLFAAAGALAQADQPLTTNNSAQACVEFGDCTKLPPGNTAATATQNAPVTPPASSALLPPATNAIQSSALIASLASAGAASAYASRVANGQPTGADLPDGSTSINTSAVLLSPPTADPTHSVHNDTDAALALRSFSWAPAFAAGAVMVGVVYAL